VIPLIIPTNALSMRRESPPVCDTRVLFAGSMPSSSPYWPSASVRVTFPRCCSSIINIRRCSFLPCS